MKKLPLMIIGVSLLFLGLGGIVKEIEKYLINDESKCEFVTVSERIPPPPGIREIPRNVVIIDQQQQGEFSNVSIKVEPPLIEKAQTGEFTFERQTDGQPLKVTTGSGAVSDENDVYLYKNESENPNGEKQTEVRKMRIVVRKNKKLE